MNAVGRLPEQNESPENLPPTKTYLVRTMLAMIRVSVTRSNRSFHDMPFVFLILVSPMLYFLRFRGLLKTPIGTVRISSQESMRSFVYGLFKTHFWYLRKMGEFLPRTHLFSNVFDVGACLGDFTLAMARQCGRIIAVEPGAENFSILCSNLRINSITNVTPLNVAAHDGSNELRLSGNASDLRVSRLGVGQHVKGVSLDTVIADLGIDYVDLIKIDVQGHEKVVLDGLANALAKHRVRLVIVEVHAQRNVAVEDVTSLMGFYGYNLVTRDNYFFHQSQLYFSDDRAVWNKVLSDFKK